MRLTLVALIPHLAGSSFVVPPPRAPALRTARPLLSASTQPSVLIEADEPSVGAALCTILRSEYEQAIAEKGSFVFCISGGSMLKMLAQLADDRSTGIDWSRCTMGFVSHRCVPLDADGATYAKALPAFLQSWAERGLNVLTPTGSTDADAEAGAYEAAWSALPRSVLPYDDAGFPVFDLLLIGVGMDGHVGSIYPNIPDVDSECVFVPITGRDGMGKISTKISLSLAAMRASKTSVVACAGTSAKAPLGKAEAMVRALEAEETPFTFPAAALRSTATWLLDTPSAALLTTAKPSAAAPADAISTTAPAVEEMTPLDNLVFVGYIGGFVVFFYAVAAIIGAVSPQ